MEWGLGDPEEEGEHGEVGATRERTEGFVRERAERSRQRIGGVEALVVRLATRAEGRKQPKPTRPRGVVCSDCGKPFAWFGKGRRGCCNVCGGDICRDCLRKVPELGDGEVCGTCAGAHLTWMRQSYVGMSRARAAQHASAEYHASAQAVAFSLASSMRQLRTLVAQVRTPMAKEGEGDPKLSAMLGDAWSQLADAQAACQQLEALGKRAASRAAEQGPAEQLLVSRVRARAAARVEHELNDVRRLRSELLRYELDELAHAYLLVRRLRAEGGDGGGPSAEMSSALEHMEAALLSELRLLAMNLNQDWDSLLRLLNVRLDMAVANEGPLLALPPGYSSSALVAKLLAVINHARILLSHRSAPSRLLVVKHSLSDFVDMFSSADSF